MSMMRRAAGIIAMAAAFGGMDGLGFNPDRSPKFPFKNKEPHLPLLQDFSDEERKLKLVQLSKLITEWNLVNRNRKSQLVFKYWYINGTSLQNAIKRFKLLAVEAGISPVSDWTIQ